MASSSPHAVFAQNVCTDMAQFEQQLTTAYQAADQELGNKSVVVSYTYNARMGDLRAQYQFTLQSCSWPYAQSPYNKVFLFKPICKELDYANLDEQTHAKIDAFIANNMEIFHPNMPPNPANMTGLRMENCSGSKNLRKINLVAVNYFAYSSKDPTASEKLTAEIKQFEAAVEALSADFKQIMSGQKTIALAVKTFSKKAQPPKKLQPPKMSCDLPLTNLQAADLMPKQAAFNALFTPASGTYTRDYSFDMRDGGMQFDVLYSWNASQYVATKPAVFFTYFNVIKPFQEDQRKFCEAQSSSVTPEGSLELAQNDVDYFQYVANAPWPTNLTADEINNNLAAFSGYRLNVS